MHAHDQMKTRLLPLTLLVLAGFALTLPERGSAQTVINDVTELDSEAPEAWAMAYYTSVGLFHSFGAPRIIRPGQFILGFEGGLIPQLSDAVRRVGFSGTKLEDTNKSRLFGRLRLGIGLPASITAELGFVPPVERNGAKPALFAAAFGIPLRNKDGLRVGGRLYGQLGKIKGDFTCDQESFENGTDIGVICEGVSQDEIDQRYVGAELSASDMRGNIEFFLAGALNYLDNEFRVDAQYHFAGTTQSIQSFETLRSSGWTWSLHGGVKYLSPSGLALGVGAFYTPLEIQRPPADAPSNESLFNIRAILEWHIGGQAEQGIVRLPR